MLTYFETNRPCQYKLSNTEKTAVSILLDHDVVDKIDRLALNEQRSRNYIVNRLLSDSLKIVEKNHGKIKVDAEVLKQLRRRNDP